MGSGKWIATVTVSLLAAGAALIWAFQLVASPERTNLPPPQTDPVAPLQGEPQDAAVTIPTAAERDVLDEAPAQEEGLLQGEVLTSDGEPIAGAHVELKRRAAQSFLVLDLAYAYEARSVSSTNTDEAGQFSFRVPSYHPFELHVGASGFARETLLECYAGEYHSISLHPGAVLQGHITRAVDGSPVEGARLKVYRVLPLGVEVVSDPSGFYRFDDLPSGQLSVEVLPLGNVSPPMQRLSLEPGQVLRHDIQVESGGIVTGTITDATTGRPIRGAEIGEGWTFRKIVRTDVNGQYEFPGLPAPGVPDLAVRAEGYGKQIRNIGVMEDGVKVMDFQLLPAGSANGRVVNTAGHPLPDIYVAGVASERDENRQQQTDWQGTRTDDTGHFFLKNLRPDLPHALLVRQQAYGTLVYEFPELPGPGHTVEFGDVTLQPGAAVLGRVVDQEGNGLPDVQVSLKGTNEDRFRYTDDPTTPAAGRARAAFNYVDDRQATTDEEGAFRVADLSPGGYAVMIRFGLVDEVQIQDWGQVIEDLVVVLDTGLSITGSVLTTDGAPVVEAFVEALPEQGGRRGAGALANHEFELRGLQPGTYAVEASSTGRGPETPWMDGRVTGVAAGSEGIVIVVSRQSSIEGVVHDAQGEPAAGISVRARVHESFRPRWRGPVLTDENGRFRLAVGEGEILDVIAGPPVERVRPTSTPPPDPERSVTRAGVAAGTRNLVIQVR